MTTEKALREALENSTEMLRHCRCLNEEGAVAEQVSENRAALSLSETQGEPVAWMNTAGRVISAKEKINAVQLISEGGEFEIAGKAALSYSIRLGVIK